MSKVPAIQSIPTDVVAVTDYEAHAQSKLDSKAWAYFSGGAGDEITLRANRSAWNAQLLHPRVLKPLAKGHTRLDLLGRAWAHPIMLAPVAGQSMAHPDGELGSAYAAAAQGAGIILSTQASIPLEQVASALVNEVGRGALWFQLYIQHDRDFTRTLVKRAEQAGYEALVLTVDAPTSGARDRERRAQFRWPAGMASANLQGLSAPPQADSSSGALLAGQLTMAPTWSDIAWLQSITHLPILLKGILHEDDARQAAQLGVAGLIVSNHGGRTLDTAIPTAWALPRIAQAVGPDMPLLVDGGIRRGTDVLKAIALGAHAVLIGRPYVHALATAGALGVAHVIRLLRDELEIAMALTGCATLDDITPDVLFKQQA